MKRDLICSDEKKNTSKPLVVGYLRVSSEQQTIQAQKLAIYDYARKNNLVIDFFEEVVVSSAKSTEKRRIDYLLSKLKEGDTLVVSELSRLGRSTVELLTLVKRIVQEKGLQLIVIKQNMNLKKDDNSTQNKVVLAVFSLLAEIERDLIVQRTKEGLVAARSRGKVLGKPKGTIQASPLDQQQKLILQYLHKGLPVSSIAKLLGLTGSRNLANYIKRRSLK